MRLEIRRVLRVRLYCWFGVAVLMAGLGFLRNSMLMTIKLDG